MPDAEPLKILVDTDVHVASSALPRRVVEALRRQLRQHEAAVGADDALSLLVTREGTHRMPQALLGRLIEACRKQHVPFAVVDRRAMVACPPLRSRQRLEEPEREAVRRLLLRDSGVAIASEASAPRLAAELVARRQQRTLIVVEAGSSERWLDELGAALGLGAPLCVPLKSATAESRVVVGRYHAVLALASGSDLRAGFGLAVFDGVDRVDAVTLMNIVRAVGARYLLGLAAREARDDGLEGPLFLALGGQALRLSPTVAAAPAAGDPPRLGCSFRQTRFEFPAYGGRDQYQALVAALAADAERARQIAADVAAAARVGHRCLVLSERRDHLEALAAALPAELACATLTSAVGPAERARLRARFEAGELAVLLATGQIASEEVPAAVASRLFLTFPFSYARKLEPLVRALAAPRAGKTAALLLDYDDARVSPLHRAFEKRRAFLERLAREASEAAARARQLPLPV
jgi:hypothetical protein